MARRPRRPLVLRWRRFRRLRRLVLRLALAAVAVAAAWLLACVLVLVALRWFDPPTTAVQVERRVGAWLDGRPYAKRCRPMPLSGIADDLEHAVVAAEDTRFYRHHGVDWGAVETAIEERERRGRLRGGSTITQQLVKNLFLSTGRSWPRKVAEVPLAYLADAILSKQRILELYLNVVEWGDGVYGAEAASRHWYGRSAATLTRRQAAALAACLPAPRRRVPQRMDRYADIIEKRLRTMGW